GIEHVSLTGRQLERLHPVRVLVQQEAQVGGGWRGRGDGQQHTAQSSASGRVRLAVCWWNRYNSWDDRGNGAAAADPGGRGLARQRGLGTERDPARPWSAGR